MYFVFSVVRHIMMLIRYCAILKITLASFKMRRYIEGWEFIKWMLFFWIRFKKILLKRSFEITLRLCSICKSKLINSNSKKSLKENYSYIMHLNIPRTLMKQKMMKTKMKMINIQRIKKIVLKKTKACWV